jgi:two-component system, sensor histidine kinase RpfC
MHTDIAAQQSGAPETTAPRQSLLGKLKQRLRNRPDSEHEMTPNRMVFAGSVIVYLLVATWLGNEDAHEMLLGTYQAFMIYFAVALAIFAHILWKPGVSVARRLFAMVCDFSMISYAAAVGGIATGFFYPFFLWTIFGNGFRFGIPFLHAAMLVGNIGFLSVLAATGIWRDHLGMSIALSLTLVMLPLYAGKLIKKISEAREQAEEANRAKSAFLASISHELRTPLNAVIGLGDLLRNQIQDPEQRHMVRTIADAGRTLLNLINSILDFSRAEAGKMPSNVADIDVFAEMRGIETMLEVQADAKSIDFNVHISARVPRQIRVDFGHLKQVLVNLSANAIKFTESGHVVVSIDAVRVQGDQVRLRFEVADTGIGIAPDAQKRIFEAFSQADTTILDRFGGTGLGLAISKQLVKLMNGEIGLASEPGKGSTFWFEVDAIALPLAQSEGQPELQSVMLLTRDPEVEDIVRRLDCDLVETGNVRELLQTVDENANTGAPLIVILDRAAIGDENVPRTLHSLRRAGAQTIFLAGPDNADLADIAVKKDCVTVLTRPIQPDELNDALHLAALKFQNEDLEFLSSPELAPNHRALSILVAEDNLTNQMVISKILERAGHRTTLVNNGQEALDALNESEYDLVLMDVNMPVLNGIEATKLHRFATLDQPQIPIVALTADATADALQRCEEAGVTAYATKPIEPKLLLEIIDRVTSGSDSTVEDIRAHVAPEATQSATATEFDMSKLNYLEDIGGREFVSNLVTQFSLDSSQLLQRLGDSAANEDLREFHEALHALRSSAANVGATRVFESCLSLRSVTGQMLSVEGATYVRRVENEVQRALSRLSNHAARSEKQESNVHHLVAN